MVIGNGLLSKAFSSYNDSNDILIFSSGVSDSSEVSKDEFNREFELIRSQKTTNMKFVYFSSININNNSRYFEHKKEMEYFIIENFKSYIIFRLPNIVGFGGNDKTIFNYFKNKIKNDDVIIVKDVFRSLIDVDDLKKICDGLINLENNKTLKISYIEKMKVVDIINEISKNLGKTPNIINCNDYISEEHINNSEEVDYIINKLGIRQENYTKKIIEKYGKH